MLLIDVAKRIKENPAYHRVPIQEILQVLRDGFDTIGDIMYEAGEGATIQIPRFGSFHVQKYKRNVHRNPSNGKLIRIPARLRMRFKMSRTYAVKLDPNGNYPLRGKAYRDAKKRRS